VTVIGIFPNPFSLLPQQGEGRGHRKKKPKKEFFRTTFPSQVFWKKVYCRQDVSTMMMAGRYALMIALAISSVPSECKPAALHHGNRGHQKHCSEVRDRPCVQHTDCACVNRHNRTLICTSQGTCGPANGNFNTPGRTIQRRTCPSVQGKPCIQDSECACVNPDNTTLYCNFNRQCAQLSPIEVMIRHIQSKLPCPKVYKRRCEVNDDCPCSEHPLICEENECVRDKQFTKSLPR